MNAIEFTLPFALQSLNVRERKHYFQRRKEKLQMKMEIIAALGGTDRIPPVPFARARITVTRCSWRFIDPDSEGAACKGMIDCLRPQSDGNPAGIGTGIIRNDSAKHIELIVKQQSAPRGQGCTLVRIEKLD